MARFDNKVVLVSGGARGQGAAEARLLVAQGAKVVIGDVLDNQGQSLAIELGPAASFVRHDVTSEADWARAVQAAQKLGGLHGLVNNAGIYQPATLMETDDALWQRHIQINQYGCFLGMKAVVPAMERSGGGSIVNISSVAGLKGSPGSFAYAATKWALRGMTKSGAIDLGGRKIRVNSVHPGPIDTDMIVFRTPEQREERMKQVPMHRYGTPEEVAQLQIAGSLILSLRSLGAGATNARRSRCVGRSRPGRGAGCDRRNGQTRRRAPACRRDGNAQRRSSSSASARPRGGARRNCRAARRRNPRPDPSPGHARGACRCRRACAG